MSVIRSLRRAVAAETVDERVSEVTRTVGSGQHGPVDRAVLAAVLREVRAEDDPVLGGALVAGVDGLVLAAETYGSQVEMLGVMAAAVAGVASQIVAHAGAAEALTCLIEGSAGHVGVFPLPPAMVLVVIGRGGVSTGRFNLAARGVLSRLRAAVAEAYASDAAEAPALGTAHEPAPVEVPVEAPGTGPDTQKFEPVNRVPHVTFDLG
ncbi:roadblock/LC7 domain-containing protein [Actinophytocola sp.]|uniref:roadblock/LC7 domain-containing protein n=1 Tax=Actinophytocola sp. TaxID=1872138 RepID=UPI00389A07C8